MIKNKIKSYILSAPFPNSITLFWILSISIFDYNIAFLIFCLISIILSQLDALSRYREYKRAKKFFTLNGIKYSFLRVKMYSRCQRDAIIQAAKELNLQEKVKEFYKLMGYKWYNIVPDRIMDNPFFVFTSKFWKTFWVSK